MPRRQCGTDIPRHCDDGLQHYALQRDIELVVVDAARRLATAIVCRAVRCANRLRACSVSMRLSVNGAQSADAFDTGAVAADGCARAASECDGAIMRHRQSMPPRTWCKQNARVHAVAGIGNPERFFATLRALGCDPIEHAFPDHHAFRAEDLAFDDALPIVMTEKDAMKCAAFASDRHWYLQVRAQLPDSLATLILGKLNAPRKT